MRALVIALAAGLATLVVIARPDAQPSPPPDFAHAKELYDAANAAMTAGDYGDAVRGYGAAYEITKDPVLFFKIGTANEKLARCDVALVYYARYVREAKPTPQYVDLTKERIAACGGDPAKLLGEPGSGSGSDAGSGAGSASGSAAGSAAGSASGSASGSGSGSDTGSGSDAGSGAGSALGVGSGSGSGTDKHVRGSDTPWLLVGGALAFVTAGAVLAYSASSSEQDIRDLYIGLDGMTPAFDAKTMARYNDLVDEGHRYQYLSWGAFGIAAGFGIAATILFVREHDEHADDQRVTITPHASPSSAGVSATVRF
jgi:hypothetical protein